MKSLGYGSVTECGFSLCEAMRLISRREGETEEKGLHICYNSVFIRGLPWPRAMGARALTFVTEVFAPER